MKGFVTLAVGNKKYYKLALNLLKSYKLHTHGNIPFAIICDRKNKYTEYFDKVIILKEFSCSYMDKLELLNNLPYEENIFIDADCLVYADINEYWQFFPMQGVSCFGRALEVSSNDGWFNINDIGSYKEKIDFIPQFHGGIMFLKNDNITNDVYKLSKKITNNYSNYKFKYFDKPADEPILALSTALMGCKPIELPKKIENRMFVFYPAAKEVYCDISNGYLSYINKKNQLIDNVFLCHYQNFNTEKPKYKIEAYKINHRKVSLLIITPIYYLTYFLKKVNIRLYMGIKRRLRK